ncbi:MAG: HTH domain-containing protein [Bacteroidota bacterium]
MPIVKYISIAARLHDLIKKKATGTPYMLAQRLKVSERMIYIYIEELKKLGAPIHYDFKTRTYYYSDVFKFDLVVDIDHSDAA